MAKFTFLLLLFFSVVPTEAEVDKTAFKVTAQHSNKHKGLLLEIKNLTPQPVFIDCLSLSNFMLMLSEEDTKHTGGYNQLTRRPSNEYTKFTLSYLAPFKENWSDWNTRKFIIPYETIRYSKQNTKREMTSTIKFRYCHLKDFQEKSFKALRDVECVVTWKNKPLNNSKP